MSFHEIGRGDTRRFPLVGYRIKQFFLFFRNVGKDFPENRVVRCYHCFDSRLDNFGSTLVPFRRVGESFVKSFLYIIGMPFEQFVNPFHMFFADAAVTLFKMTDDERHVYLLRNSF